MKRIERIYHYLKSRSRQCALDNLEGQLGFEAAEIAEHLDILRNNVSMELNILWKQGKVIKIQGRPVRYFDQEILEHFCRRKLDKAVTVSGDLKEIIKEYEDLASRNPFSELIGAEGSLKNQVEQAKAALLYPPNGLHTLILGPTGVGKTLFVNLMVNYGKQMKKLGSKAPFVVFNCADYYNNPQLLMSHLFGHVKGAFTGAETDKPGLVEKADQGILFLDEIHRLPPEGQEMIFYFMDTGGFNRLGETERKRHANVLLIGATTEEHTSSLIKTFIRRIPIIITIPSLEERPLSERLDIVKYLLSNEAHRVNKSIKITGEAVKAIIGSVSFGNIGQLKSNIQLACAKAFLNGLDNQEFIEIDFKTLPDSIKHGLLALSAKRREMDEFSVYLEKQIVISPQGHRSLIGNDPYEPPFNLYKIIEDKTTLLKEEGLSEEYIKGFITTDINLHLKSFYDKFNRHLNPRQKLLKIVDKTLLELVEEIRQLARFRLKKEFNERFLYALSLHLSAFFKRLSNNQPIKNMNIESVIRDNPQEYALALEIKAKLETAYNVEVPEVEMEYLTILLSSVQAEESGGQVAVLVVAHGGSTASSMVNVTQKLLDESNVRAIDMPLEVSPKDIFEQILENVQVMDQGKGVLMLVDMGSLTTMDALIMEKTNVKVRTLDMVSTPLVLEAVRKATIFKLDLDSIYHSLKEFKGYGGSAETQIPKRGDGDAIITICTTGEGAALQLKELVEEIICGITTDPVEVIPVGIKTLSENIASIRQTHTVLACVGMVNPNLDFPFISLESLLGGDGEKALKGIMTKNSFPVNGKDQTVVVKTLCQDTLNQFLTYLNPAKIYSVLDEFCRMLEYRLNRTFGNTLKMRLIIHCGCALERMVLRDGLTYKDDKNQLEVTLVQHIKKAAEVFRDLLQLELSDDEICYIAEML